MFAPFTTRVHATQRLSPSFIRITFTGEELRNFGCVGSDACTFDRRIKLIFPSSSGLPVIPEGENWYRDWQALPEEHRGHMRTYSIRRITRPGDEVFIDIDFVRHLEPGTTGPATLWAEHAGPGDELLLVGPTPHAPDLAGVEFLPGDARRLRLFGDETAAPAIARILEDLPRDAVGEAVIEVPTAEDRLPIDSPPGIRVTWLHRDSAHPDHSEHGSRLAEALELRTLRTEHGDEDPGDALLWETPTFSGAGEGLDEENRGTDGDGGVEKRGPEPDTYFWIAGESGAVTRLRRELVRTHDIARRQVSFMGYWRRAASPRTARA